MAKITISMPDAMSEAVQAAVVEGQYGNVSEYFRDLVRRDQQRRQAEEDLRRMLAEGDESGYSDRTIEEVWDDAERAYLKRNGKLSA